MIDKMEPSKIEEFIQSYESKVDERTKIKEQQSRIKYRQNRLLALVKKEIAKYSSMGFEYKELNSQSTAAGYKAVSFSILYKERDLSIIFKPEFNQGSLQYSFARYSGEEYSFCSGYLFWNKERKGIASHWYLEKNHDSHSLKNMIFDEDGIKMLLTNIYSL